MTAGHHTFGTYRATAACCCRLSNRIAQVKETDRQGGRGLSVGACAILAKHLSGGLLMDSVLPPVAASDEWPQEPDGFQGLKFGGTKEEACKLVTFEWYGISAEWGLGLDDPYPTRGVARVNFAGADITESLIFHPAKGLQGIQGVFSTDQFEVLKSAFISLYGKPHEETSGIQQFPEMDWKTYPPHRQEREANVESLIWYSDKVYISLVSRAEYTKGQFQVAYYTYMKHWNGGAKMLEKAKRKLAPCTQDEYKPPGGWTQEPDDFNGLKLGMTKAEAERHVTFGKCTVTKNDFPDIPNPEHFLYETTLSIAGLNIPGEALFIEDRLINLGGKYDKCHWDAVKSAFTELYGRPHCDRREEMIWDRWLLEKTLCQTVDWSGERVWIRMLNFPGHDFANFYFQRSLTVGSDGKPKLAMRAFFKSLPQPPPPKIEIEHTGSKLILHLPDGTALDYQRGDPLAILQSSWHQADGGGFVYELQIDTRNLLEIGTTGNSGTYGTYCPYHGAFGWDTFSQPDGWSWDGFSWRLDDPADERGIHGAPSVFSITSAMLPGPMPVYLTRKDAPPNPSSVLGIPLPETRWPIPFHLRRRLYDAVRETLGKQETFLNNVFIMGPAIEPNSTDDQLRRLIHMWIDRYGFDFLKSFLQGNGSLSAKLDQLEPATDFERQIVDCLRRAIQKAEHP